MAIDQENPHSYILLRSLTGNATLGYNSIAPVGWVASPNSRGTLNILFDSLLTIFLCTWTAVCLNIPHPADTKAKIMLRKANWMVLAILGPEIVLSIAIGQYASARRSVKRFSKLGYPEWSLRHAFFADMGGIVLQPKDSKPFVVNARQLAYLVQNEYVALPNISAEEIWDRSKADTLAKFITMVQATWLVVQLIGRAAQHLETTTLELSTGAIVICTACTFVCWLHKPADVRTGIVLGSKLSTADMLLKAGDAAAVPYTHTPLDFVSKQSFTCSYDVMKRLKVASANIERPLQRLPDDRFPDISTWEKFALFCMTMIYSGSHMIGWNFAFPSKAELILWRIASSVLTGTTLIFWIFETVAARQRFGRWDKYLIFLRLKKPDVTTEKRSQACADPDDAFEQEQRLAKPILAWEVGLIVPVISIYATARFYMIVEAFLSFRKQPLGVYAVVSFTKFLPHWQ